MSYDIENKDNEHKSFEVIKGRYAKLFADVTDENREKMVLNLRDASEINENQMTTPNEVHEVSKDEHKAANEVHEEMKKAKKANTDDPEKEEMKAQLKDMQNIKAEPMIKAILQARKGLVSNEDYTTYEKSLRERSFSEIKETFEDQRPLFSKENNIGDSIVDSVVGISNYKDNDDDIFTKGMTFAQIENNLK